MKLPPPSMWIGLTLVLVLGAVYGYGYLSIKEQNIRIAELNAKMALSGSEEARQTSLLRLVENTNEKRDLLRSFMVRDDAVANFLEEFESLRGVTKTESEILSVSTGKAPESLGEGYETLVLSATATGTFSRVMHMLVLIESLPYPTTIQQLRLERANGSGKNPLWALSVTFEVLKERQL